MSKDTRSNDSNEKLHYKIILHIARHVLEKAPNEMTVSCISHANKSIDE